MLHVGLDLIRRRLDVCVLSDEGELVEELAAPPDPEGLRYLVSKLACHRQPVRAVIESMTGARFIHDTLEQPPLERQCRTRDVVFPDRLSQITQLRYRSLGRRSHVVGQRHHDRATAGRRRLTGPASMGDRLLTAVQSLSCCRCRRPGSGR